METRPFFDRSQPDVRLGCRQPVKLRMQFLQVLHVVVPLLPGDVIFTGTPAGVGLARKPPEFLQPGDVLETWVEGIGSIRNQCVPAEG